MEERLRIMILLKGREEPPNKLLHSMTARQLFFGRENPKDETTLTYHWDGSIFVQGATGREQPGSSTRT